jgi:flagellin-like protein
MTTVFTRRDQTAVSPVIGTILMVAVTVVLAAVLYAVVSGVTPNASKPPTAQFSTSSWGGNTTVASYSVGVSSAQDVAGINISTLKFVVAKADNTPCYSGAALQNLTMCSTFKVNVRYLDTTVNWTISPGDSVLVTVAPAAGNPLQAGKLTVQTSDDKILGTITLS